METVHKMDMRLRPRIFASEAPELKDMTQQWRTAGSAVRSMRRQRRSQTS